MAKEESPFAYEEVFSLILSLVQQLQEDSQSGAPRREKVQDYFERLTKWALGEYEFARRLAFEGIPVIRLAPYTALMSYFHQKPPEDFIFLHNGERACVDVKYYDSLKMLRRIEIPERYVGEIIDFKERFRLDRAFLSLKRFERWYMLDANAIRELTSNSGRYLIDILWARQHHEVLREDYCVFNMGERIRPGIPGAPSDRIYWKDADGNSLVIEAPVGATRHGILYDTIQFDDRLHKIKFEFSRDRAAEPTAPREYSSPQYWILRNLKTRLEENFRVVLPRPETAGRLSYVSGFEDLCPTVFSICDGVAEFAPTRLDERSIDLALSRALTGLKDGGYVVVGGPDAVQYYVAKLYTILLHEMQETARSLAA
jgi:hypothetical protein